ncbi:MAG: zinc ribbon domain-containing protein [Oscillospiraceae bacterium]|nr:zinc ribbon domain-containing protein [Oscillospiraceae bacterium]
MAKFCKRCGRQLGADGRCPNCGYQSAPPAESPGPEKKAAEGKKRPGRWVVPALILALLLILLSVLLLQLLGVVDFPPAQALLGLLGLQSDGSSPGKKDDKSLERHEIPKDYLVEPVDAEAYYRENAESYRKISVKSSKNVQTEKEAAADFARRGFDQMPITAEYAIDGSRRDGTGISEDASDKHPTYETYYTAESGEIWLIQNYNGAVTAYPMKYNELLAERGVEKLVAISETDSIMCYDCETNCFFEVVPKPPIIVKTVDRINSYTLEALTAEEIDRL